MKVFVKAKFDVASDKLLPDQHESRVQSLTELINFNSVHNASHPFCVQAKADGSLNTVTHAEFKDAVSRCAEWMRDALAPSTPGEPVALLMESDFGLVVHEFALISAETPPLVLSPRLPLVAIEALLKAVGAKALITSPRFSIGLKAVLDGLAAKGTKIVVSKPYGAFSSPAPGGVASPPLEKPKALDEMILLLHSSGSTGLPKPIPLTHRMLLSAAACYKFDSEEQAQGLNLTTLPMFHGFGLVAPALSMAAGKTTLFPASDGIPNARSLVDLVRRSGARSMMTVPMLLDDICNLPAGEGIRALAPLDFVGTGGAALGAGVGDRLAAGGVRLLNFYGVTETGPLSLTFVPSDDYDWHFFRLRRDIEYRVTELEPRGGERRFRLAVFPPGKKEAFEIADQLVRNERHPDTDFAAVGRDDDIIVLATGEKADPLILESMLNEAPAVKAAVAFGDNRFHLGVIIESQQELDPGDEAAVEALRESIWAVVQAAGAKLDSSARVPSADAIVIIPAGMRMPRTDKGSIARKEAYALFAKEIDEVYEKLLQAATQAVEPLDLDRLEDSLADLFRQHTTTRTSVTDWNAETSLFDMGVDSLQMQQLRRILVAAVSKTPALSSVVEPAKRIPPQFFYVHPIIREMAAAIITQRSVAEEDASVAEAIAEVNECIANFRLTLPADAPAERPLTAPGQAVVLLTGSSGSLGAHCLAELARRADVVRVICLVRKDRGTNSQPMPGGDPFDRGILKTRGLQLGEPEWAKVATIEVDPAAPRLGLNPIVYTGLQGIVTHVVHAAWPMNYLLPLRGFHPQFAFLRNLLELAAHGRGHTVARFVFVSSIAAVARIGLGSGGVPIPEAQAPVETSACGVGYADGKLVCEKILGQAARDFPGRLEVTAIRCGQITGARHSGMWNEREQIPMLLKSGQNLGSLPRLTGTLSWIPVDDAACVVADVALGSDKLPTVLHLENPVRQPWNDVMGWMSKELGLPEPSLSFDAWLEEVARRESRQEKFPVQQLYLFFKKGFEAVACGEVVLDTQVATKLSSRLRELEALDKALLGAYIAHWKKIRYLST